MALKTHGEITENTFGRQAGDYLTSATHASGEDLAALESILSQYPGASLLDLGCGAGHVSYTAAPLVGSVTACDISENMLSVVSLEAGKRGYTNITTCQGNSERLPFSDALFDLVVSRYSAHHWPNVGSAMREAGRVLKKDGQLIIIDVASPGHPLLDGHLQSVELLRDGSHIRDYSFSEWLGFVAEAGFTAPETRSFRLHLEFSSWVSRMDTPDYFHKAIRQLQKAAPVEVASHYAIEEDGSFTVDVLMLRATRGMPR